MSLKALCRAALAVAALFAIGAGAVQAQVADTANTIQSLSYREFKKGGRFYVFNNPAAATAFSGSGYPETTQAFLGNADHHGLYGDPGLKRMRMWWRSF